MYEILYIIRNVYLYFCVYISIYTYIFLICHLLAFLEFLKNT